MTPIRTGFLAICLLIVSLIALTACGGDDDDNDENGNGTAAEVSTAADGGDETPDAAEPTADDAPATDEPADEGGDDDDESGGGAGISDPCSLLTQSDVEAALGESVQAPVVTFSSVANIPGTGAQADVGSCNYVAPTGVQSVSLTVWSAPGEDEGIQGMIETACANKETLDVAELACWYDSSHLEVQMASGGSFVDMFLTSTGDTTAILQSLAETAAARLP